MKNLLIGAFVVLSTATLAQSSDPCADDFAARDADGNGALTEAEYCPDNNCPADFSILDVDASGDLSYEEFSVTCELP